MILYCTRGGNRRLEIIPLPLVCRKLSWLYSPIGQVKLSAPATELTSVSVQWGAGDPASGTDQNAIPLALSIEASVDGGQEWQGITGGGEAVDVALAHKASLGSSQHRYPVSLLDLRRKRRVPLLFVQEAWMIRLKKWCTYV